MVTLDPLTPAMIRTSRSFLVRLASVIGSASLLAGFLSAVEPQPLWPSGAPGAKGAEPKDTPRIEVFPAPKDKACGAGVVVLPGGGYGGLAADHEGRQIALFFNQLGVTAVVCHYRLGTAGYHHPVPLNDAKRAVRWLRNHAEGLGVDPGRVGVIGFSAGGHLASTVGTLFDAGNADAADPVDRQSSRPDFLVLGYPVISMSEAFMHRGSRNNLLGPEKDNEDAAREVSSERNVTPQTPPTFILQTDEDTVVPAENAVNFYLALRKNKVPAEMHIYRKGPHGVGLMQGDPVLSTWGGLLSAWLRNEGFLSRAQRASVEGTVSVNGTPVAWGSVTFTPQDRHAPEVTARVMNGRFNLPAPDGAALGPCRLTVAFTSAVLQVGKGSPPAGGFVKTTLSSNQGGTPLTWEVKEGLGVNKLTLDLKWQ